MKLDRRQLLSAMSATLAWRTIAAGIANRPEDIDVAMREISALARS